MKVLGIFLCVVILANSVSIQDRPWMNPQATPRQRAQALLEQMTLTEKLSMVHGYGGPYVGNVNAIPRLNIPALHLEDGPQGVADGVRDITCWPSALTVVTTWNTTSMYNWAAAMATEQRIKGTNIMLGPMMNIARVPMGGRNFESFGEDPHLAASMAGPSIKGIQDQGVMACAKHFVDNNQEYHRTTVSENVDERTQHEIYYPAFQAAVDAQAGSFMCSYNKINNTYACENDQTLNKDLKGEMGYQGFVMSDWGATHSTVASANNGLDMQMPDDSYFGPALTQAVANGQVKESRIDDMVLRILQSMFQVGLFDRPQTGNLGNNAQSAERAQLARALAAEATVLLKNTKNLLPLPGNVAKIAIIGDDGDKSPTVAGGGSGHVIPPYVVSPYEGIKARAKNSNVTYAQSNPVSAAQQLARECDIAIVFVSADSSEGSDRPNLSLPNNQDNLVSAIAAVQPNTIVVLHVPGATLMPWAPQVTTIVNAFLPGQEDGNAIAQVLFGDVNPSARLAVTFPVTEDQIPVNTQQQYPGINDQADYSEKLQVGYRWYDAKAVQPLFPFGHGLSYTTFVYSSLSIQGLVVSFEVKNTGNRAGSEVPQLYLGFPASAGEPPKQLKGYTKIALQPAESQTVSFTLSRRDISIWDITSKGWKEVSGTFNVWVGASSRDLRLSGAFNH